MLGFFNSCGWQLLLITILIIIICAITNRYSKSKISAQVQNVNFSQGQPANTKLKIYGDNSRIECILRSNNCLTNTQRSVKLKSTANKNGTDLDINIQSDFCGRIEFDFLSFKKYDMIGLTYKKINVEINGYCTCLPEMIKEKENEHIAGELLTTDPDSDFVSDIVGKERSELMGVREYKSGDSFKDIHWKLSFKQGDIMIKEYASSDENNICLYLETSCPEGTDDFLEFDILAKKMISLSSYLLSNEQTHFIALKNHKTNEEYFDKVDSAESLLVAKAHILNANPKVALPSFKEFRDRFSTYKISNVEYFACSGQETPVDENIMLRRYHN